ncbi:nucleotidyltransferase domain-containing protein [Candidatus Pacearchaeota archaeon]|nr:nucleotidyltransferase domain-containing protein [Candidatus Pacearchaeota archaeon]
MNLKIISEIKSKLKGILKDKDILDIILFGSMIKGKSTHKDIDIAIITKNPEKFKNIEGFHVSLLSPEDFFVNPPSIINALFREGYSIKKEMSFAETYKFENKCLFKYDLTTLKPSNKVKIVNVLRGKNQEIGMVKERGGKWLANQIFVSPIENDYIFEQFFLNFKVKFQKLYILIH